MHERRAQHLSDDAARLVHVDSVHRLAVDRRGHLPVLRAPPQRGAGEPAARSGRGVHEADTLRTLSVLVTAPAAANENATGECTKRRGRTRMASQSRVASERNIVGEGSKIGVGGDRFICTRSSKEPAETRPNAYTRPQVQRRFHRAHSLTPLIPEIVFFPKETTPPARPSSAEANLREYYH